MAIRNKEKAEELEDWVESKLIENGPTRIDVLHFGSKSTFYSEGKLWFKEVLEKSDRFSLDPYNRVHLNGD